METRIGSVAVPVYSGDALSPSFLLAAFENDTYLCGNQISGAPSNPTHWLISTQACSAGSGTNVAHSSSVLGYVARQEPSLTTERACEQFLRKVASCWWRGENGSDDVKRDVFQCSWAKGFCQLVPEKMYPQPEMISRWTLLH